VIDAIGPMVDAMVRDRTTPWVMTFAGRRRVVEEAGRLGLHTDHADAGMVLERRSFAPVSPAAGVEVTFPAEARPLEIAGGLFAEAFDVPVELFAALYEPGYVGRVDVRVALVADREEPVSTAIAWSVGDDVGIFNVATPPRFRGRRYGALATSAAIEAGFALGASRAFLQASAVAEGIYRRLGFREVSRYLFLGPRGDDEGRAASD
jgi:ribosomal protein S18 acetylase RimI-like enzyme